MKEPTPKQGLIRFLIVVAVIGIGWYFVTPARDHGPSAEKILDSAYAERALQTKASSPEPQGSQAPPSDPGPDPSRFMERPIRYPENGQMGRFTLMLPTGFVAGIPYPYEPFEAEVWKRVEGTDHPGDQLACGLKAIHDSDGYLACMEAANAQSHPDGYWQIIYYSKIRQTWLEEVKRHPGQTPDATITILKVARGRHPNLNME